MLSWNQFPHKTSRGGVRYGLSYWDAINATWPSATLTFTMNGLEIAVAFPRKTFRICAEHIVQIRKVKDIFSTGYQIVHRQFELPKIIIFWVGCDRYFDRKLALWKHFVMDEGKFKRGRLQPGVINAVFSAQRM